MIVIKGIIGGLFQTLLLAIFLIIPAGLVPGGTWFWQRGIILLAAYAIMLEGTIIFMAFKAPASLEARYKRADKTKQPKADKGITSIFIFASLTWLVSIPLDAFSLKLFPKPDLIVSLFGAFLFILGFIIIAVAIYQNSFAVPYVEDQTDRGQTLVDRGLYGIVRHPLYMGILPWLAGAALWLQSYLALCTLIIPFGCLIARIFVEEKTLSKVLPGYDDYKQRVRYRLIPFIW